MRQPMLYGIVLGIHACALLAALLLFVVGEFLLMVARRGQPAPARIALLASRSGGLMAGIGLLAGIVLLFVGGWSLLTPWLIASFVLIATLSRIGRGFVRPWEALARSALAGDATSKQITRLASEKTAMIGRATVIALFGLIAGLMTMKPDLALFLF